MRIKSTAPFIALILSLFALGVIAIESIIPTALVSIILYAFGVTISYKLFFSVLTLITIIRGSISKPPKFSVSIKEE